MYLRWILLWGTVGTAFCSGVAGANDAWVAVTLTAAATEQAANVRNRPTSTDEELCLTERHRYALVNHSGSHRVATGLNSSPRRHHLHLFLLKPVRSNRSKPLLSRSLRGIWARKSGINQRYVGEEVALRARAEHR
jgi:hypothetical protein